MNFRKFFDDVGCERGQTEFGDSDSDSDDPWEDVQLGDILQIDAGHAPAYLRADSVRVRAFESGGGSLSGALDPGSACVRLDS